MSLERRSAIAQASKQKSGRSAKSRDQQMGREVSTSDNTSSDKGEDRGGKSSLWGSPMEMLKLEIDKRAAPGTQSCLTRDVDMAVDSSNQGQGVGVGMGFALHPAAAAVDSRTASTADAAGFAQPINLGSNAAGVSSSTGVAGSGPGLRPHPGGRCGGDGGSGLQQLPQALRLADQQQPHARGVSFWDQPAMAEVGMRQRPGAGGSAVGGGWAVWGAGGGERDRVQFADNAAARVLSAPRPPLFSAAAATALSSLSSGLNHIQDPRLEMQLQDIVNSARLEGQGWFSGAGPGSSAPGAGPGYAGADGGGLLLRPGLLGSVDSGWATYPYTQGISMADAARTAIIARPLVGCEPMSVGAPAASRVNSEHVGGMGPMDRSLGTAAGGGGGGGGPAAAAAALRGGAEPGHRSIRKPESMLDVSTSSGAAAWQGGGAGGSLLTCMQYLQQQQQQQQQQLREPRRPEAFPPGRQAPRELVSYRPGEPDPLVRMALKLTSRAPDELEATTIASLRKLLSVYDKLQSMQGYVRPGCTQLIVDAHRISTAAAAAPAAALGSGATASDASDSCSGAAVVREPSSASALCSGASSGMGSWCDESVNLMQRLPAGVVERLGACGAPGGESLLCNPQVLEALLEIAAANNTAVSLQLEDVAISVAEDGTLGPIRKLEDLPMIAAASCVAVSSDSTGTEVALYGSNLSARGATFWARMHGVCYQLQTRTNCDGGVVARLPMLGSCGLLQLEAAVGGAIGPSYPLLVVPGPLAVNEVHSTAAAMGPASLRRFVTDFGAVLGTGTLLSQPLNGVVPVRSVTAAAGCSPCQSGTWGSTESAVISSHNDNDNDNKNNHDNNDNTNIGRDGDRLSNMRGIAGMSADTGVILNAAQNIAVAEPIPAAGGTVEQQQQGLQQGQQPPQHQLMLMGPRRRGGGVSRGSSRGSSRTASPATSGTGGESGLTIGADPTDGMTNADDEQVVEALLNGGAVQSLLESSVALLQTMVERGMQSCTTTVVSKLLELQERFPDRVHVALAPPPRAGTFGPMHAAARSGDVPAMVSLLALEGLLGEHCSLQLRGVNGVTPLHMLAVLPQAPRLLLSLQWANPGVEQALVTARADDGLTPLQLYRMTQLPPGVGQALVTDINSTDSAAATTTTTTNTTNTANNTITTTTNNNNDDVMSRSAPAFSRSTKVEEGVVVQSAPEPRSLSAHSHAVWTPRRRDQASPLPAVATIPTDMLLAAAAAEQTLCEEWGAQGDSPCTRQRGEVDAMMRHPLDMAAVAVAVAVAAGVGSMSDVATGASSSGGGGGARTSLTSTSSFPLDANRSRVSSHQVLQQQQQQAAAAADAASDVVTARASVIDARTMSTAPSAQAARMIVTAAKQLQAAEQAPKQLHPSTSMTWSAVRYSAPDDPDVVMGAAAAAAGIATDDLAAVAAVAAGRTLCDAATMDAPVSSDADLGCTLALQPSVHLAASAAASVEVGAAPAGVAKAGKSCPPADATAVDAGGGGGGGGASPPSVWELVGPSARNAVCAALAAVSVSSMATLQLLPVPAVVLPSRLTLLALVLVYGVMFIRQGYSRQGVTEDLFAVGLILAVLTVLQAAIMVAPSILGSDSDVTGTMLIHLVAEAQHLSLIYTVAMAAWNGASRVAGSSPAAGGAAGALGAYDAISLIVSYIVFGPAAYASISLRPELKSLGLACSLGRAHILAWTFGTLWRWSH